MLLLTKFLPLSNHPCKFFVRVFFLLPLNILQLLSLEPLRSLCVYISFIFFIVFFFRFFHFVVSFFSPSTYSLQRRETAKTIWIQRPFEPHHSYIYKFSVVNREFQTFSSFIFLSVRFDGLLFNQRQPCGRGQNTMAKQNTKPISKVYSIFVYAFSVPLYACHVPCVCVSA